MSDIGQRGFIQTCAKLKESTGEIHSKLMSLFIDIQQMLGESAIFKRKNKFEDWSRALVSKTN